MTKKIQQFNVWFSENYLRLKGMCVITNLFGEIVYSWQEDIFHNTYIFAVTNLDENINTNDFECMFINLYRKFVKQAATAPVKEIVPSEIFWKYQQTTDESEEENELESIKHDFAVQLYASAKQMFSNEEFTIFKLRFESGFKFVQIAAFFGVSCSAITRRYECMCNRLFHSINMPTK